MAKTDEAKFTQADMDRVAGSARGEGRSAALAEVAEQLGMSVDEAKAAIATIPDLERERDEAKGKLAKERLGNKIRAKLIAAGVGDGIDDDEDGKKREAAIARATRMLSLDDDANDDAIDAEIEAAKGEVPSLFTPTEPPAGPGRPPAPKKPAAPAAPVQGAKTMAERGQEALRKAGIRPKAAA